VDLLGSLKSSPNLPGLSALYASTLLSGAWAMLLPTIPVLSAEFGVSAGAAAQIVTAFSIGRFVGTASGGIIIDRMGSRAALVGGPLASGIASLLAIGAPWMGALLVLALVMGMGDSWWSSAREVTGIDLARKNQRGRVLSSLHGTHNIGLAICPLVGGILTDFWSFRGAFVAYGLAAGGAVLLGFKIPESPLLSSTQKEPLGVAGWGVKSQLKRLRGLRALYREIRPELRATYLALVLATLAAHSQRVTVQSMLPLYAGGYLQLAPTDVGLLFTISGIFVFAMIVPAGIIMDRVGRKWATVPSTGIPALAFLLIPFTDGFFELAVLVSFTGLSNGLSLGSVATSTYDVVPEHTRGRLQAVRRTVAEVGGVFAPLAGGYLANRFNPGVPFFVYAPLLVLSATLLALVGRETLEK
jgi:MFS family permease